MTRRNAIGKTVTAFAASAGVNSRLARAADSGEGEQIFLRLLKNNDETVGLMLKAPSMGRPRTLRAARGGVVAALVASYCSPESSFYKSESLIPLMERDVQAFLDAQHPDGTLDAGNLDSPPDTAFVVEATAAALGVARRMGDPRL